MVDYGLVSVVMPAYNCVTFIGKAIESVIAQTYTNWELLITDDCSTDSTRQVVEKYASVDKRIRYFCLQTNSGAGIARNNSIQEANGRFIAFLDSDDMWMPHKLETQLRFMQEKDCALSGTSYLTVNEKYEVTGLVVAPRRHTLWQCMCDSKLGFSTCIYDTSKIGKHFMPPMRKRQDWGLVLKMLRECKVAYEVKEPLGYYLKGHDSLSKNKQSLIKYNISVYRQVFGWSYIRAFLFFWIFFAPTYFMKRLELRIINR